MTTIFNIKKNAVIPITVLFIIIFFLTGISLYTQKAIFNKQAVIIAKSVDSKFEPVKEATTHFTLYEGMKVSLLIQHNGWCKIKRYDDKIGWIEQSQLEIF
jgi:hypothetical protein